MSRKIIAAVLLCSALIIVGCDGDDSVDNYHGLSQVKWFGGKAVYTSASDLYAVPLLWERSPLYYCLYFNTNEMERYSSIVDDAARLWNTEVGCTVLRRSSSGSRNCAVRMAIGAPDENPNSLVTHYGGPIFTDKVDVVLPQSLLRDTFYLTAVEQFGRALGLKSPRCTPIATPDATTPFPVVENNGIVVVQPYPPLEIEYSGIFGYLCN